MLITCPTCAAKYKVDDIAIGPNGRNVQCDSCGAQWRQAAPEIVQAEDRDLALALEAEEVEAEVEEEAAYAAPRPKTPGLDEAAELLQEMREESARTDLIDIFDGDKAAKAETDRERAARKKEEDRKTQQEVRSLIASANKSSPKAEKSSGGGFKVGFIIALMFVAGLAFAYVAKDALAEQFPAAASALAAYAEAVDMIRGGVENAAATAMKEAAPASQ